MPLGAPWLMLTLARHLDHSPSSGYHSPHLGWTTAQQQLFSLTCLFLP